jgi:hypothetical protein
MSGYLALSGLALLAFARSVPRLAPTPALPQRGREKLAESACAFLTPTSLPPPLGEGWGGGTRSTGLTSTRARNLSRTSRRVRARLTSAHFTRTFTPVHPRSTEPQDFP